MEGILEAITALMALITKALPDDELKRERLKLRYPLLYQNIKVRQLKKARRFIKQTGVNPEDFVKYVNGDTTMVNLLTDKNENNGD